jgi:hypothetical protein
MRPSHLALDKEGLKHRLRSALFFVAAVAAALQCRDLAQCYHAVLAYMVRPGLPELGLVLRIPRFGASFSLALPLQTPL